MIMVMIIIIIIIAIITRPTYVTQMTEVQSK